MILYFLIQRWVKKQIKLRVILGVLFISGLPIQAQQQMTAEWVETRLGELGSSRKYIGRVAYQDSLGSIQIEADSAIVTGSEYVFVSNLKFQDSVRVIRAKELRFNEKEHVAQFLGDVFFQDKKGSLSASEIVVWPDSQKIEAKGGSVFDLTLRSQRVKADRLTYDGQRDHGVGLGNVVATVVGDQGDSLCIQTDSLHFASQEENFSFWGISKIQQLGMGLFATRGRYQGGILQASGSPEIYWSRSSQADSVWAKADSIDMRFNDQELRSFALFSGTVIKLSALQQGSVQTVRGDSARITLQNKDILSMWVFDNTNLHFEKEDQTITLRGDSVAVWFTEGNLDSLEVYGPGDGKYQGKDDGVSQVSGDKKTLWFKNNELVKMIIVGNAFCHYVARGEEDVNRVNFSGDTLVLDFAKGELSQIDVVGQVKGVYLQNKTEKMP